MKTEILSLHPEFPDLKQIARCAKVIRRGGLVIFPTETVYGIAADFTNDEAIRRLRAIKRRSSDKPFSVMIAHTDLIGQVTRFSDPLFYKLMARYWPGPLTMVIPGLIAPNTIGVRIPDNIIALKLLQAAQCLVAAPSANLEGKKPPRSCQEALEDLDGLVDMAIDGGATGDGVSSSVIDLMQGPVKVLREGTIKQEDIKKTELQKTVLFVCTGNSCRSVMGEYLLKKHVAGRDDIEVLSAGTSVFIQGRASGETVNVLAGEGIDARGHISRPIDRVLLKKADLIFVMTQGHRSQVLSLVPEIDKRVYLLRELQANKGQAYSQLDVPDPIGQSHAAYKDCLEVIRESVDKIVKLI
ncbi:L-threonylcarbamoyladenylate synthase [Candidatus Omnitrophota bacterium]